MAIDLCGKADVFKVLAQRAGIAHPSFASPSRQYKENLGPRLSLGAAYWPITYRPVLFNPHESINQRGAAQQSRDKVAGIKLRIVFLSQSTRVRGSMDWGDC